VYCILQPVIGQLARRRKQCWADKRLAFSVLGIFFRAQGIHIPPQKKTYNPLKRLQIVCSRLDLFFGLDSELQIYHGIFLLMDVLAAGLRPDPEAYMLPHIP